MIADHLHRIRLFVGGAILAFMGFGAAASASAPAVSSLQCYGKDIKSLTATKQMKPELFQVDGTCYSYAATASLEAAYARKHGVVEQIFPVLGALRRATDIEFSLSRILRASDYNEKTRTIGFIPDGFFDGGLVTAATALLDPKPGNGNRTVMLPKYTRESLLEYNQFSQALVDESSCQFYQREPLYLELADKLSKLEALRARFYAVAEEQKALIETLEAQRSQRESHFKMKETMALMRSKNVELESMLKKIEDLTSSISAQRKFLANGTPDDRAFAARIQTKVASFEADLLRRNGGVNVSGLKPVVVINSPPKVTAPCDGAEGERRKSQLLRALCGGIPVGVGTYQMRKFLVRGGFGSGNWEPYLPTGSAGDAAGGAGHAMTLVGFDDINGVPHFVFRNSWGRGSEAALPASEVCAIDEAVVFLDVDKPSAAVGAISPSTLSEYEAWTLPADKELRSRASRLIRKGMLSAVAR